MIITKQGDFQLNQHFTSITTDQLGVTERKMFNSKTKTTIKTVINSRDFEIEIKDTENWLLHSILDFSYSRSLRLDQCIFTVSGTELKVSEGTCRTKLNRIPKMIISTRVHPQVIL